MNGERTGLDRVQSCGGCLVRGTAGGLTGLFLLVVLVQTEHTRANLLMAAVAAGTAVAALITTRQLIAWALGASAASFTVTLMLASGTILPSPAMLIEVPALLVVITRVSWRAPQRYMILLITLTSLSVIVMPLRAADIKGVLFSPPIAVVVGLAVGFGLYLRAVDNRRARALVDARRYERLELARDLHDFVAHHVTGIVVQAQAARFAAQSGAAQSPEQLDTMLAGIEKAGTEALTSMRRLVGLLREAQAVATRPVGDLSQLAELVDGFTDPPATLTVAPDVGTLPPEIATSLHRIAQEALTNARKHAADATAVRVSVHRLPPTVGALASGAVELAVRDNGQGRGRRLPSGGFGLAGLAERVEALGGRFWAGPLHQGGWEVVVVLPLGQE